MFLCQTEVVHVATLNLKDSNNVKLFLSAKQEREIKSLYTRAHYKLSQEIQSMSLPKTTVSDRLREMYLDQLRKSLESTIASMYLKLLGTMQNNMFQVSQAVVSDMRLWLDSIGYPQEGAFEYIPEEVVQLIVTGQIYEGKWSLSKAVWKNRQKTLKDVSTVISEGLILNKSTYDIAKDIERYIDPKDIKDWDWNKVYPGTAKRVDYNAQRLARTLIQHSYQQSVVLTTKDNPFVEGVQWISAFAHGRTCELCKERATEDKFGLGAGVFPKNKLPLDHPNGLCSFGAKIDSMDDIVDRLADWANGKPDKALDKFDKSLHRK